MVSLRIIYVEGYSGATVRGYDGGETRNANFLPADYGSSTRHLSLKKPEGYKG
jgi:hypothetical protein